MKIELLYFDGCPNHEPLIEHLHELLERHGIDEPVALRRIESAEDAERERFLGSPTLRIDSRDVDPTADERDDYGFKCRLYRTESGTGGLPADEWILAALNSARDAAHSNGPGSSAERIAAIFPGRSWAAQRTSRLSASERRLHRQIVRALATGEIPEPARVDEWALAEGLDGQHARSALQTADLVHFDPDTGVVLLAYPFSATPTAHRVRIEAGTEVFSMCAIDALGIAFMLGQPTHVTSADPRSGERIEASVDPHGESSWSPEQAVVVVAGEPSGGASAECMCPHTNFAATADGARAQLESLGGCSGTVLSMLDAIDAAREGFGELLASSESPS